MAPGERSHKEMVESKQGNATRPEPVLLTTEIIEDNTLETVAVVKSIELLFTSFGAMPGLKQCPSLLELTLIQCRLTRMPSELQHVRGTLRRLNFG